VLTALAVLDFLAAAILLSPAAAVAQRLRHEGDHSLLLAGAGASALLAGLAVAAGMGLWQVEEYGRRTQMGLLALGLPLVPVGTFLSILLYLYLAKPGTRLLFAGWRDLSPEEADEASRPSAEQRLAMAAAGLGLILAVVALLVILGVLALASAAEPSRGLSFGPPPRWVETVSPDLRPSPPASEISGGVHFLLVDRQTRVSARGQERFGHYAKRIVNEAGLDAASQLSIDYDPGYESVEIHYLRLRRGGAAHERLSRHRVELVQRETELEAQVYDGTLSAVTFIEDLRVGDVVEYAYTLRGANPVIGGLFTEGFDVEWSVPLRLLRHRLLWPRERTLLVRNHGTSIAPRVRESGAEREYLWETEDPAPVGDPGPVPPWFTKWAWVQLSEFASWAEVAAWARPLYPAAAPLPPALAAKAAEWRGLADEGERARAALRFVQEEVRYVGIEMGTGSHRPSPPETVLDRRFGDCKDKSLLLATLLGALGVKARPALVHTSRGAALDDWLPTPYAFNHVVTRAEIGGRTLWLDPTRVAQGGQVEATCFPDYERALVVEDGTDGLVEIAPALPERPTEIVEEDYRAGDEGKPVEYRVVSRYEGCSADRIRTSLRRRSRDEVAQGYVDFYAKTWPGIRSLAPLEVEDDRDANVLVTRERYSIPRFWTDGETAGRKQAELHASTLADLLEDPEISSHAPLAVTHPVFVRHLSRVRLPGDWGLEPESVRLDSPAARFSFAARPQGDSLGLEYEYRSLAASVASPAVDRHVARLGEMRGKLAYRLTRPAGGALGGTNWAAVMTLGLGLALGALGSATLLRLVPRDAGARRPRPRAAPWVLGALVAGALLVHGAGLLRAWRLARPAAWAQRTLPDGTLHHGLWAPFLLSQLVIQAVLLVATAALLALLASRRRMSGRAFVAWAFAQTALLFATAAFLAALPGAHASGLEPLARDALLSLVPLVPGTALALARGRA
jgi:transglutaminase-like putative cysteine protease